MKKHYIFRISDEERAILHEGAEVRHKTVSEYLRWLFLLDHDTAYRLTDAGREALEKEKPQA